MLKAKSKAEIIKRSMTPRKRGGWRLARSVKPKGSSLERNRPATKTRARPL